MPFRVHRGFWHRHVPVDSLCLYRAGFGAMLCIEALSWLPYTTELFSNQGFHVGPLARLAPPPAVALALCLFLVVATACVAAGWRVRAALAASLLLWSCLCFIDAFIIQSIHRMAIVVMTILLFSACDARYSVDDWIRRRRGWPRRPATACIFPLRLLQLQFAQAYFFTGLAKWTNPEWHDGTVFARCLRSRWASEVGVWVSGWIPPLLVRIGGPATIVYELLAGFLLFVPKVRPWMIACGLLFHLGIDAVLAIGSLGKHFMWALLLLYPDPETVARWAVRMEKKMKGLQNP